MKRRSFAWGAIALLLSLFAAIAGATRPLLLTALVSDQKWMSLFFSDMSPSAWLRSIPSIYVLLALEILQAALLFFQGLILANLSANISRYIRVQLCRSTLRNMADDNGNLLSRYISLNKTYVDVIENYLRQCVVPSIAAIIQIVFSLLLLSTLGSGIALLLFFEVLFLLLVTLVYARIYEKLAIQRLDADERLLTNTSLNQRKGIAIWFGGLGGFWFRQRIQEIRAVRRAHAKMGIGEAAYFNLITMIVGLFVVVGYFVIANWEQGNTSVFLAFLLYSGLITGPVLRISAFIPESREYLIARKSLSEARVPAHKHSRKIFSDTPIFFSAMVRGRDQSSSTAIVINPGDRIAFIGASGSGKTSIIEALLGAKVGVLDAALISDKQASSICFDLPHIGVRYANETPVFEKGTILHNCQAALSECTKTAIEYGLFSNLNYVELVAFFQRHIVQTGEPLSFGERQRVQLIRILTKQPRVIILDEALSGIAEELEYQVIEKLISKNAISVIIYIGHRRLIQSLFANTVDISKIGFVSMSNAA